MNLRRISGFAALFFLLASALPLKAVTITNVTPPLSAPGRHLIDIYGNGGFAPNNQHPASLSVDFNGVVSTTNPNFVVDNFHIQVTNVPAGALSGYIHVTINGGTPAASPQPFIIISTNAYATNFTPTYGNEDTVVSITGVQFQSGQVNGVSFNGTPAKSFVLNSDNSISATAPAGVTSGPLIILSSRGATHNFSTISNQITTATNFFAQPSIVRFFPTNGIPGASIVITGLNFNAASAVALGSLNVSDFTISNNTIIRFTVPPNASTGKITVSPPTGTILSPAQSTTDFRVLPNIANFSPTMGTNGTTVTLTGSGLNEESPVPIVTIGGGVVTAFTTVSPGTLIFKIPATASSGPIIVNTTNGSAISSQIFYLPTVITNFTPTIGAAGTIVKITGKNFTNASAVTFNGIAATDFAVTNNNTIGAVAPAGVTSGIITVTTPFGTTNSSSLFYVAPTISDFTPNHGLPGTRVMITGTSFTNATAVAFDGIPAASFIVTNNTTLSAVVPDGVTTGPITVTAPGGTGQSTNDFTLDATDLSISASALPNPVFLGSNLVYTIVITNNGPTAAFNVRFTNTLAQSVTLKSGAASQGSLTTNSGPITGSLGTLGSQSAATIILIVTPTATGFITNAASVGTDSLDSNLANNAVFTVSTVWPLPFLSITNLMSNNLIQVSWPLPLSGFTLQYRTSLSNEFSWTNDTSSRAFVGTNVTVIETNIGTPKFFRLTN